MKKVYMKKNNDCTRACLATLLQMDYNQVPDFNGDAEPIEEDEATLMFHESDYWRGITKFLSNQGLALIEVHVDNFWGDKLQAFCIEETKCLFVVRSKSNRKIMHHVIGSLKVIGEQRGQIQYTVWFDPKRGQGDYDLENDLVSIGFLFNIFK